MIRYSLVVDEKDKFLHNQNYNDIYIEEYIQIEELP